MDPRNLLTVREAARRMRKTERTVDRLRAAGKLTTYRVGARGIRVDAAEVDALIASEARTPAWFDRGTPIWEYDPDFTEADYAALARIFDGIHARRAERELESRGRAVS